MTVKTVILTIKETRKVRVEVGDDDDDFEYQGTALLQEAIETEERGYYEEISSKVMYGIEEVE